MPGILLTGPARVGKTTALKTVANKLAASGTKISGFYTEEVRQAGNRVGFDLVPWAHPERRIPLARIDLISPIRISAYGVDVDAVRQQGLPALQEPCDVVLLDEIAGMELSCPGFTEAVGLLQTASTPWVATIHLHPHPYTDRLKEEPALTLLHVTPESRETIPATVLRLLNRRAD